MIAFPHATAAFELGFTPAAAAILSLGPQNTFVLRHGLSRSHVVLVVGTCFGCDLGLMTFAVLGLGSLQGASAGLSILLRWLGAAYLVLTSARLMAGATATVPAGTAVRRRTRRVVLAALAASLFNPLAWIESVLVLGAISSTVAFDLLLIFAAGAAAGSLCKFGLLGFGARLLAPLLRHPGFARGFDALAALVMLGMAIILVRGLSVA